MSFIEIKNLTKSYSKGKTGIFDINLNIEKGKCMGIIGINGAGKTTLIRCLMGFIKPEKGSVTIDGLDSWKDSAKLKERIAYIPGEIGFPIVPSGDAFIKMQANIQNVEDLSHVYDISKSLALDTAARLKTMSKGMKQKTAIIAAFIKDKDILIFDEPTTGLDPLMRNVFIDLINQQKALGKTIIFSTHIFLEAEKCCDFSIFLNQGHVFENIELDEIFHNKNKSFRIGFQKESDLMNFSKIKGLFNIVKLKNEKGNYQIIVSIPMTNTNKLIATLAKYSLTFFTEEKYSLVKHFTNKFSELDSSVTN